MARKAKVVKAAAKSNTAVAAETSMLVPTLKSSALSTDVGPKVAMWLADATKFDREASELAKSGEAKRYDSLVAMTQGIVKAAKADNTINLAAVFEEAKSATKARLNNQIYLALGFKSPLETKGKVRFAWTEGVSRFVEAENAADPMRKQKDTVRTNLAHMMTKCIHAAIHIVENKVDIKSDKASGTLALTGPTIKGHFGEATVLLNEKQTVKIRDKKGNVTGEKELKHRPSFTEIARLGAEAHGKSFTRRVDSRAVSVDPHKHIVDLCAMLVKALEKAPTPNEAAKAALESVYSAIEPLI